MKTKCVFQTILTITILIILASLGWAYVNQLQNQSSVAANVPALVLPTVASQAELPTPNFQATTTALAILDETNRLAVEIQQTSEAVFATSTALADNLTRVAESQENATATAIAIANQPIPTATATPSPTPTGTATRIPTMTPTPDPIVIFFDDFNDGIKMNQIDGQWIVSNGLAVAISTTNNSNCPKLIHENSELDNYVLEVDVKSGGDIRIILAYKDSSNYMSIDSSSWYSRGSLNHGTLKLITFKDGEATILPSSEKPFSSLATGKIRIEAFGNNFKLYKDERLIYDFLQLPQSLEGSVGVAICSNAIGKEMFDNFRISTLSQ